MLSCSVQTFAQRLKKHLFISCYERIWRFFILRYINVLIIIIIMIIMLTLVTRHGTWGRSPLLLMSLVDGHCVLLEPSGWWCLQLDFLPSAAELFRSPQLKSGTLYQNTSSQPLRCSPSGVTWTRFYHNNLSAYSTLVDLVVISVT